MQSDRDRVNFFWCTPADDFDQAALDRDELADEELADLGRLQHCVVTPVGEAPSPGTSGSAAPQEEDGFSELALVSADDVTTGDMVISATVFVSNGFNVAIDPDLLFGSGEPHVVELPYTFWISIDPVDLLPQGQAKTTAYPIRKRSRTT